MENSRVVSVDSVISLKEVEVLTGEIVILLVVSVWDSAVGVDDEVDSNVLNGVETEVKDSVLDVVVSVELSVVLTVESEYVVDERLD